MRLNKDRIRQRFASASATYDSQAVIQLRMAEKLLALLGEYLATTPARILEVGCCTGLLTERLQKRFDQASTFYVNDLVADFRTRVAKRLENDPRLIFMAGDIEKLAIPEDLDLVVSSSTLHWLEDLPAFFRNLSSKIVPGGTLCFSIYGTCNLAEVRAITGIGLDYLDLAELKSLVGDYFEILTCEEEKVKLSFDDPLVLLKHLRETGVNALDARPWTLSRLEYFRQEYTTRFSSGEGVVLTYHPMYCIARKKA